MTASPKSLNATKRLLAAIFAGAAVFFGPTAGFAAPQPATVEGVAFRPEVAAGDAALRLRGCGLMRYMVFIKAYVAALYLPEAARPNLTFEDELTVYAGGQALRLVHFPRAHTDGDTVVFMDGGGVVHMGDMFFNGMFPFMDVGHGGDIESWIGHLDKVLSGLPEGAKIIPGHGPLATAADLKAFRDMLADSASYVGKAMKAGRSLEAIKADGLPAGLEPWAKGFMNGPRWLELVYRSLEKNSGAAK